MDHGLKFSLLGSDKWGLNYDNSCMLRLQIYRPLPSPDLYRLHGGTHALLLSVLLMQRQPGSLPSSLLVANLAERGRVDDATPTVLSLAFLCAAACMKAVFQGCQKNSSSFWNNQRKAFV